MEKMKKYKPLRNEERKLASLSAESPKHYDTQVV